MIFVPGLGHVKPLPLATVIDDVVQPFAPSEQRDIHQTAHSREVALVLACHADDHGAGSSDHGVGSPVCLVTQASPRAAQSSPVWVPKRHLSNSGWAVRGLACVARLASRSSTRTSEGSNRSSRYVE